MTTARMRQLIAVLACAWSVACGSKDTQKLTQIVVVVDSDLAVPGEHDALHITVDGVVSMPEADVSLSAKQGLPRSLGLVHAGGPLGPVRVSVRGQHAGDAVVERSAEVTFVTDHTLKLALTLTRACAQASLDCAAGETCVAGECASETQSRLPEWNGKLDDTLAGRDSGGAGGNRMMSPDAGSGGGGVSGAQAGDGAAAVGGSSGIAGAAAGGTGGAGGSGEPNQAPSCSIESPTDGARYYEGDTVSLNGSCNDPETGTLLLVRWRSSRDGSLGVLNKLAVSNLSAGEHVISLCATDPEDNTLMGCASEVHVTVQPLPAITASIKSITQASMSGSAFSTSSIDALGEGSGVDPLTFAWTDSVSGDVGSGDHLTLSAPVQPGKHTLVLRVTDGRERAVTASQTFTVLPAGKSALFEAFAVVNSALSMSGNLSALAASGGTVHLGTSAGVVYAFDATSTPSMATPTLELTTSPAAVHDITLHTASSYAFIATDAGLRACPLTSGTISSTCTTYSMPGPLPSTDVKTSVRLTAASTEYLLAGTAAGLVIGQASDTMNMLAMPKTRAELIVARAVVGNVYLWLATSNGLVSYDLSAKINGSARTYSGSPTALTALALGSSGMWVASGAGLARYDLTSATWTKWNVDTAVTVGPERLISNDVRALAITRPTIAGNARDVIWVGTNQGVSRYDTTVRSFATYTTADGLPSNSVRAIVKLDSGELVFGTDAGLAIYRGL